MIRCVRLWTGSDGDSHFEEGRIDLKASENGDLESLVRKAVEFSFRETKAGGANAWHKDPMPRFVVTLRGTLRFETRGGGTFVIYPGDILLAQDNTGTGHRWKLIGEQPWQRAYVVYAEGAEPQFLAHGPNPNGAVP